MTSPHSSSLNHDEKVSLNSRRMRTITMEKSTQTEDVLLKEPLKINRTFNVSPDILFEAFLDAEQVQQWWGPEGFTSPSFQADPKVGGTYLGCMKSPEGQEIWSTGTFIEIDPVRTIRYTDCFADAKGQVVPSTHYGMNDDFPLECIVELSFAPEGESTRLMLKHYGIPHEEIQECTTGWSQSLDKLERMMESSLEVWARKMAGQSEAMESRDGSESTR